jgi:hypothetical protein
MSSTRKTPEYLRPAYNLPTEAAEGAEGAEGATEAAVAAGVVVGAAAAEAAEACGGGVSVADGATRNRSIKANGIFFGVLSPRFAY